MGAEVQEQAFGDEAFAAAIGESRLDGSRPHEEAFGELEVEIRHRELRAVDFNHAVDHLPLSPVHPSISMLAPSIRTPYAAPRLARSATFALRITFLLGRHAMFGHEPPIRARSITTTGRPCRASSHAMYLPASPPPRTAFSMCEVSFTLLPAPAEAGASSWFEVLVGFPDKNFSTCVRVRRQRPTSGCGEANGIAAMEQTGRLPRLPRLSQQRDARTGHRALAPSRQAGVYRPRARRLFAEGRWPRADHALMR